MNKKFYCLISLLLCVCFIFSQAAALDSWDHYKGPVITKDPDGTTVQTKPVVTDEPKNDIPDIPVIPDVPEVISGLLFDEPSTTSTLSVNSIEINGMDDDTTKQVLDLLSSLKITSQSQKGDTTRGAFAISLADTDLLSFGFQGGETYFVTSNLFGGNTYMINDEDKFEENLAASIYDMVQQMSSGSSSSMVSLEEIQGAIGAIREAIRNGNVVQTTSSFELEEEVNPTALMMGLQPIMEKFGVDDPTTNIAYRYMDYSAQTVYEWPSESELPQPGKAAAAMSGILGREELLAILDQLPIFFEDNPELAEKLNQAMKEGMEKSNPELTEKYGNDFLGGFIAELRDAVDNNLGSFAIKFKMDQDESGSPILITLLAGEKPETGGEEPESGIKISFMSAADGDQNVYEIDADAFQGLQTMPVLRMLMRADHGDDTKMTANIIFGTDPSSIAEFALTSTNESYLTGTSSSNTDIDVKASDFSAHLSIYKVDKPNLFSDNDTTTVFELSVNASGQPVFSISMTSENQTSDPMPMLTAANSVAASSMTKADYDTLAQSIFMQIMMLTMNFS